MSTDYDALWRRVTSECSTDTRGIHGLTHWRKVERIGSIIAGRNGAKLGVVRLFALLHDSQRLNDCTDNGHGARAAEFAATLREQKLFELSNQEFELLAYACAHHTDGGLSDNPTIGACWDADRIDLRRVGILPNPEFMSTDIGRKSALALAPRPGEGIRRHNGAFYTIDSRGSLAPGMKLSAETNQATAELLGQNPVMSATLTSAIIERFTDPGQSQIELVLESVRRLHFPHLPSRQTCLFACDSMESLRRISAVTNRDANGRRGIHGRVFQLFGDGVGPFDGFTAYLRRRDLWDLAISFWSGMQTSNPYREFIMVPPIVVGEQVGTL
jgi:uncharacterized protein